MHFGLGAFAGSDVPYVVATRFVGGDVVRVGVLPSEVGADRTLRVSHGAASDTAMCSAHVTVAAQTPAGLIAGDEAVIELEVMNDGPATAAGTTIDITMIGAVALEPLPPYCVGGGQITCTLADVPAGTALVLPITVVVDESAAEVIVEVALNADGTDPTTTTLTLETAAVTDLIVSAVVPESVVPGDRLTIAVTVENVGPSQAKGVVITHDAPAQVTLVEAASEPGACTIEDATATCAVDVLSAGQSGTTAVSAEVAASATGTVTILVAVRAATPDPVPEGNTFASSFSIDDGGDGNGGDGSGGGDSNGGDGGTSGDGNSGGTSGDGNSGGTSGDGNSGGTSGDGAGSAGSAGGGDGGTSGDGAGSAGGAGERQRKQQRQRYDHARRRDGPGKPNR